MSETRKEVKQIQVDYQCPKCNIGHLRPTGIALATYPPQYPHKCNNCDYMEMFTNKQYPYIDYEEITPDHKLDIGLGSTNIITGISGTGVGSTNIGTGYKEIQNNIIITPNNVDHYTNPNIDSNDFIKSNNGNNF